MTSTRIPLPGEVWTGVATGDRYTLVDLPAINDVYVWVLQFADGSESDHYTTGSTNMLIPPAPIFLECWLILRPGNPTWQLDVRNVWDTPGETPYATHVFPDGSCVVEAVTHRDIECDIKRTPVKGEVWRGFHGSRNVATGLPPDSQGRYVWLLDNGNYASLSPTGMIPPVLPITAEFWAPVYGVGTYQRPYQAGAWHASASIARSFAGITPTGIAHLHTDGKITFDLFSDAGQTGSEDQEDREHIEYLNNKGAQ